MTSRDDRLEQAAQLLADGDDVVRRVVPCGYDRAPDRVRVDLTKLDWKLGGPALRLSGDLHSHPLSGSLRPSKADKHFWKVCAETIKSSWLSIIATAPRFGRSAFAAFVTDPSGCTRPVELEEVPV